MSSTPCGHSPLTTLAGLPPIRLVERKSDTPVLLHEELAQQVRPEDGRRTKGKKGTTTVQYIDSHTLKRLEPIYRQFSANLLAGNSCIRLTSTEFHLKPCF